MSFVPRKNRSVSQGVRDPIGDALKRRDANDLEGMLGHAAIQGEEARNHVRHVRGDVTGSRGTIKWERARDRGWRDLQVRFSAD